MGIESYFINLKLVSESYDIDTITAILLNHEFQIKKYAYFSKRFWRVKEIETNMLVINDIVLMDFLIDSNEPYITLQACYSCFYKSIKIVSSIIRCLCDSRIIKYAFYCDTIISLDCMTNLDKILENFYNEKYQYFLSIFPNKKMDVLPNEFYYNVRKNRKNS